MRNSTSTNIVVFQKIWNWLIGNFLKDEYIEKFLKHNKNLKFKSELVKAQVNSVALFEVHISFPTFILYSYFAEVLKSDNVKLIGYEPMKRNYVKENLTFFLFSRFSIDNGRFRPFRILKSIGIKRFIQPYLSDKEKDSAITVLSEIRNKDLFSLLKLEICNIRVGDIFYDWHLRERGLATVDIESLQFEEDFIKFVSTFFWWYKYFQKNHVSHVFVSHTVYQQALTARIGLSFDARVILVGNDRVYKITKSKLWSDIEFLDYIPGAEEQFGYVVDLSRSRLALNRLRNGENITAAHAYNSGYEGQLKEKIVSKEKSVRIMIASHCYSDAPHCYGDLLFEDFSIWLNFLGKISLETDFDWYIKPHPHFVDSDKLHFDKFLSIYPNLKVIPNAYSNLELFEQGINVVLTVHGTISFEAAYENILVINASRNAPDNNYPFSITADSIDEYRQLIFNIPKLESKTEIDKRSVEHFFDLHHLRKNRNILFQNKQIEFYDFIGGYSEQFTNSKVFEFWLNQCWDRQSDRAFYSSLVEFLNSDSYFMEDWYQ